MKKIFTIIALAFVALAPTVSVFAADEDAPVVIVKRHGGSSMYRRVFNLTGVLYTPAQKDSVEINLFYQKIIAGLTK